MPPVTTSDWPRAVQGNAARWNVPGMTAALVHGGTRVVAATGTVDDLIDFAEQRLDYQRHDATYDAARVEGHLRTARPTIEHGDQLARERHAGDPMGAWPAGEGAWRVMEGPYRDSLIEFLETRLHAGAGDDLAPRGDAGQRPDRRSAIRTVVTRRRQP